MPHPEEREAKRSSVSKGVVKKEREMGWGGKREGSGAPKGNLNAFKHGRNSKQYQRLVEIIANDPEARQLAIELSRRKNQRHNKDIEAAKRLLEDLKQLAMAVGAKQAALTEINSPDAAPSDTESQPDE